MAVVFSSTLICEQTHLPIMFLATQWGLREAQEDLQGGKEETREAFQWSCLRAPMSGVATL